MTDFFVTCLLLWCIVLLIVVLEGREETMCDLRLWLLRGLGLKAPATARAVELRNVSFCCFEIVLVGRFCILLGFGVASMLLIILELCHVRCSCAFFLANRRSGSLE